jgi:transposase-like protein
MPKKTGLRYPQEFKAEAVQLARSFPEKSIRQLAYELGIADQTLRKTGSSKQRSTVVSEKGSPPKSARSSGDSGGRTRSSARREKSRKKPRPSSQKKTGLGEHLQVHRGGEGQPFRPYAVQASWHLSLWLLRLEKQAAI